MRTILTLGTVLALLAVAGCATFKGRTTFPTAMGSFEQSVKLV